MGNDKLSQLVQKYRDELHRIPARRDDWRQRLKPLIESTLSHVVDSHRLPWRLEKNEDIENLESVFLGFVVSPSHIVIPTGNGGFDSPSRHGGYLGFHQIADGRIWIVVEYPYTKELEARPESTRLSPEAGLEPSEIQDDKDIIQYVERFLESFIEHESQTEPRTRIQGFFVPDFGE